MHVQESRIVFLQRFWLDDRLSYILRKWINGGSSRTPAASFNSKLYRPMLLIIKSNVTSLWVICQVKHRDSASVCLLVIAVRFTVTTNTIVNVFDTLCWDLYPQPTHSQISRPTTNIAIELTAYGHPYYGLVNIWQQTTYGNALTTSFSLYPTPSFSKVVSVDRSTMPWNTSGKRLSCRFTSVMFSLSTELKMR